MKRRIIIIAGLATAVLAHTLCGQDSGVIYGKKRFFSRAKGTRSMWVWGTHDILRSDREQKGLLNFAKNPHGAPAITDIYFESGVHYMANEKLRPKLMEFIKTAHKQGACVQFLAGHPSWGHLHSDVYQIMEAISTYNQEVPPESRFDGVHLDIEPHTLPIWDTNPKLKQKFLESIALYGRKMREINPDIVFGIDIPVFWSDEEIQKLAEATDYLTLMNYTDNASAMYRRAKRYLEIADKLGKKVESGIETQESSRRWGVTPPVTFYDEGRDVMEQTLAKAEKLMSVYPSFIGFSVHHYASYKELQKERKIVKDTTVYPSQPIITIPRAKAPVQIDGSLTEWNGAGQIKIDDLQHVIYQISPNAWQGPDDFSTTAYVFWAQDGFYFAFSVVDDKIVQNFTGDQIVNGDHIELWLDLDYEGDEWKNWADEDDYQFGISPGNFAGVKPSICVWNPGEYDQSRLKAVKYAVKKTGKGYDIKMFIPYTCFDGFEPKPSQKIGINIDPSDTDGGNNQQEVLMSSSICRQYGNPRSFRLAILGE